MPTLINIGGPIASGKSSVCKILLEKLPDFAFVDLASMKKFLKPAGKPFAKEVAIKSAMFMVKNLAENGKNILVQELNPKYIKELNLKKYKIRSFFLQCMPETAAKRDLEREIGSKDPDYVKASYERVKPTEGDIIIDTDKNTPEQTADIILKQI